MTAMSGGEKSDIKHVKAALASERHRSDAAACTVRELCEDVEGGVECAKPALATALHVEAAAARALALNADTIAASLFARTTKAVTASALACEAVVRAQPPATVLRTVTERRALLESFSNSQTPVPTARQWSISVHLRCRMHVPRLLTHACTRVRVRAADVMWLRARAHA